MSPAPCRVHGGIAAMLLLAACAGCDGGEGRPAQQPPAADRIERGRLLLAQYQCGGCHAIPGVAGVRGTAASSLAGFGRRSYVAGRLPNDAAHLAAWIAEPAAQVPHTAMPALGASAADARDMAAYLLSLR